MLFLRDTVKPSIFNLELMQRPVAIDHYVSYLRQAGDTAKLMDVYGYVYNLQICNNLNIAQV